MKLQIKNKLIAQLLSQIMFLASIAIFLFISLFISNFADAQCHKVGSTCVEGAAEREVEGFRVHKNCWKYQDKFECSFPSRKDCKPLIDKDCYQINSECLTRVHEKCVNFKQTYNCIRDSSLGRTNNFNEVDEDDKRKISPALTSCNQEIRCMDGSCTDQNYKPNNEMGNAIAQLTALSNMNKYIGKDFDQTSVTIFRGDQEDNSCSIGLVDSFDCCGEVGNGWAISFKLANCNANEIALGKKRQEDKCKRIGKFCAEKTLGICTRYKVSYCCFDNKLLRAIQEQGREQLAISWGSPEHPECRGFSVDELSKIDFSKLDLSEYASDLLGNYQENIGQIKSDLEGKLTRMQSDFENKKINAQGGFVKTLINPNNPGNQEKVVGANG